MMPLDFGLSDTAKSVRDMVEQFAANFTSI
jgi:hypothetical protein